MRIIKYSFMLMLIVVTAFATESFIQKKVSVKKLPRIKQEDIVMRHGELLKETTQLLKEISQLQETILNDTHAIMEQQKNNYFSSAPQQNLREYDCCANKMQNSIKECAQTLRNEHKKLTNRSF